MNKGFINSFTILNLYTIKISKFNIWTFDYYKNIMNQICIDIGIRIKHIFDS